MEGKFLGAPVQKVDETVPGEGALIMEELEFVLKEGRLCWQDSQGVIGLPGRVSAAGDQAEGRRGQGPASLRSLDFILREWKATEYFEAG